MSTCRILIVDDHPIVRSGLARFISQQQGLEVCAEACDLPAALKAVRSEKPDVVVLDISLGNANGLSVVADFKASSPAMAVLILSMHDELLYAERALHAGAKGYIMKDASTDEVIKAIRLVARGEVYLSQEMSRRLLNRMADNDSPENGSAIAALTNRELQVFEMIGQGRKSSEISTYLHISIKTVEAHRANIKKKLNLRNHIELLQYATQWVTFPLDEKPR